MTWRSPTGLNEGLKAESQVHTAAWSSPTGLNEGLKAESQVHTVARRSPTGLNEGLKAESQVHTAARSSPTGLNDGLKAESQVHTVARRSPTGLNEAGTNFGCGRTDRGASREIHYRRECCGEFSICSQLIVPAFPCMWPKQTSQTLTVLAISMCLLVWLTIPFLLF